MTGIINYGSGNVSAIANLHKRADLDFFVSDDILELSTADKLILPGVGAFDETMILLRKNGLVDFLNEQVLIKKKPIVGFCVGMQILGISSDEGIEAGLGWIPGKVVKFDTSYIKEKPLLPHLGWNNISVKKEDAILSGFNEDLGFYYLHSYHFTASDKENILACTHYGYEFPAIIRKENIYGAQFHPEKSHSNGIQFFRNFASL
jgi:imidazole glycerol-phosphate synthase subunit HisH